MEEKVRILVSGRVQGIGYRAYVSLNAKKLGLRGYVRNLRDGKVEAVLQGDSLAIEKMMNLMRKHPIALIKSMRVEKLEDKAEFKDFTILY